MKIIHVIVIALLSQDCLFTGQSGDSKNIAERKYTYLFPKSFIKRYRMVVQSKKRICEPC